MFVKELRITISTIILMDTKQHILSWEPLQREKIPTNANEQIRTAIAKLEQEFEEHCALQLSIDYWEEILTDPPNIHYCSDQTTIEYISFNRCIEHCLSSAEGKMVLLCTYTTYTSPEVLLDKIISCYHAPKSVSKRREIKRDCIDFILTWLRSVSRCAII